MEEFDGTTRWSDGTEMITLNYSHLTSVLWGGVQGAPGPAGQGRSRQARRRLQQLRASAPMNQLQVDLADMKVFGGKPYMRWPLMR